MAKTSKAEKNRLKRKAKKKQKRTEKVAKKKSTNSQESEYASGTMSGMRRGFQNLAGGGSNESSGLATVFWLLLGVAVLVFAIGFVRC